jgi:SAM-dependent methyltransferase
MEGAGEVFTTEREDGHWYSASADFALEHLGRGPGKLLVIASPVFEALELEAAGWDVDYLDIRKPPLVKNWIYGDACSMPIKDNTYDAVSTTCVVCHVGLGRYGDEKHQWGDELMLKEIHRVLKPGGRAHVTFGPVFNISWGLTARLDDRHRIYSPEGAAKLAKDAGLKPVEMRVWDALQAKWQMNDSDVVDANYLVTLLAKGPHA